jgi:FixJ family two-component response regulator
MPVLAGIDCLKQLRVIHPDIVAVFLTGYGDKDTIVEAMRLGAYDFLSKPISNETLQATILRCCEHSDLLKQRRKVLEALLYEYTKLTPKSFEDLDDASKASVLRQVFSVMEMKLTNRKVHT